MAVAGGRGLVVATAVEVPEGVVENIHHSVEVPGMPVLPGNHILHPPDNHNRLQLLLGMDLLVVVGPVAGSGPFSSF